MLERGIYVAPSQFEALFLSTVHEDAQIDQTLVAIEEFMSQKKESGRFFRLPKLAILERLRRRFE